jgi:hypothetical protein
MPTIAATLVTRPKKTRDDSNVIAVTQGSTTVKIYRVKNRGREVLMVVQILPPNSFEVSKVVLFQ